MNASNPISDLRKKRNILHTKARNNAQAILRANHREEFNRLHNIERERLGLGPPCRGMSLEAMAAAAGFKLLPIAPRASDGEIT